MRDCRHHAELHERLDDVGNARGHTVREFLNGNLLGQDDVAHDLDLIGTKTLQLLLTTFTVTLTTYRSQRPNAFVFSFDRGLHVDATGAPAIVGALFRSDDDRLARRNADTRAANLPGFVLFFRTSTAQPQRFGCCRTRRCFCRGRCRRGRGLGCSGSGLRCRGRFNLDRRRLFVRLFRFGRGIQHGLGGGCRFRGTTLFSLYLQASFFFRLTTRFFLGRFAGLFLSTARFFRGRENKDLLLLTALRLSPSGFALLLDKRALACREFRRGQRASYARRGASGRRRCASDRCGVPGRGRRHTGGGGRWQRSTRALFTHLHLDYF